MCPLMAGCMGQGKNLVAQVVLCRHEDMRVMEQKGIGLAPWCPEGHVLELLAKPTHLLVSGCDDADLVEELERGP